MLLPYLIEHMDAFEIVRYCDSSGLSADPAINALLDFILKKAESDAQFELEYGVSLHEKWTAALEAVDFLGIATETKQKVAPIRPVKRPSGRKPMYLPTILKMLKNERLTRADLVLRVNAVHPAARESSIYRAISEAEDDRKIIALDDFLYYPR